ncbi:hypothetical protein [Kordiimonas laminariae]|uniref:hypothetical protein n=1 Tax=Kordiimonas laminariae TaxID=2917717 RepID=UPI001FF4ADA7|nr:hypothetical protein [Kordiimonas laminariae]MCK0070772.1 hypothetical protein [Kordiimonas laminariae]
MHYSFESTQSTASDTIAREESIGTLEAKFELRVAKIGEVFKKLNELYLSTSVTEHQKLIELFELSKPTLAADVLEAKSMLIKLEAMLEQNDSLVSQLDIKFEEGKVVQLAREIEKYESRLLNSSCAEDLFKH